MINVTKTYLPAFDEYASVLRRAWDKAWVTHNGELVQELEAKLKAHLGVCNLLFTSNGTVVLQMALKVLNITEEVITTPFSYVATTNALLWEGCKPVFVDINPDTFFIDVNKIEAAITQDTQAILATHVYGIACDVDAIELIAQKHGLKVIYDGAHAFGAHYKGRSLLSYGDISTCSFHATKLFHTGEGGCIISNDDTIAHNLMLFRQFGHVYDDYFSIGINAKNSEFHAAMGLCILPKIEEIISDRQAISKTYDKKLGAIVRRPTICEDIIYNYAYYPVVFETEAQMLRVIGNLRLIDVNVRRYFYPSLNELPYLVHQSCYISEDISRRVICLPLYYGLSQLEVEVISETIIKSMALC